MLKLTPRQSQVLACIEEAIETTGYPPTRAEIARELGFRSANAAEEHLRALARKGAIEMMPGTSRGIRLSRADQEASGLPIVGRVAAGSPVLAQEQIDDYCNLDPDFFSPQAHYLLRVQGLSMMDAGILEGDLLAVHQTSEARNGQILVVRLGEEVTVKRFQKTGNRVRLLPENANFTPIEVDLSRDHLSIEGLAVGVIRRGS